MEKLTEKFLTQVIQKRPSEAHKGTFGHVVLIGGNEQFGGAIMMSAEAAVRSGSGLTTVITSEKNHSSLHVRLPESMVLGWQQNEAFHNAIDTADVLLVGPGLGLEKDSESTLKMVLNSQKQNQWLVIDGSAITLFAEKKFSLNFPEHVVFTPHQIEWQRLSQLSLSEQSEHNNSRIQKRLNAFVVLKSHRTEIYTATKNYRNTVGTPAMATGGMGDTLAGIITGFLAQFNDKEAAICAAVYLHSLIGDDLSQKQYVVLPTEISKQLPFYMKKYEQF